MPKHPKKLSSRLFRTLQQKRHTAISWMLQKLYGKKVYITPHNGALVKAVTVFWYNEGSFRKFVMVRESANNTARACFPSCYSSGENGPISESLYKEVSRLLGSAFTRALDLSLLEVDRVAAAPTLSAVPTETGQTQVQAIVWLVQITKEQADLCMAAGTGLDILVVPEFALLTEATEPLHKVVYQSVRRKLMENKTRLYDADLGSSAFRHDKSVSKMVH